MPKNLGEIAPTPAADIEMAGMGIALQALLNRQTQALHAAAHVRVPSGDPDPDAARYRDHRRLRTARTRPNASASTFSSTSEDQLRRTYKTACARRGIRR